MLLTSHTLLEHILGANPGFANVAYRVHFQFFTFYSDLPLFFILKPFFSLILVGDLRRASRTQLVRSFSGWVIVLIFLLHSQSGLTTFMDKGSQFSRELT